jgi:hypothetical protein
MRKIMKKIIKEEIDWIDDIPGLPNYITLEDVASNRNPKNVYRIEYSYDVWSYDVEYSVDDWYQLDPYKDKNLLTSFLLILELCDGMDLDESIDTITQFLESGGIIPYLKPQPNEELPLTIENFLYEHSLIKEDKIINYRLCYYNEDGIKFICKVDADLLLKTYE